MKKVLLIIATICSLGVVTLGTLPVRDVMAVTCPEGTKNHGASKNSLAECDITVTDTTAKEVTNRIDSAINLVLSLVGVAAVAVIIIGGIQYITAQGDAGKAVKARSTIIYGIVGLVICLLAYAIVNFVLTGVFG